MRRTGPFGMWQVDAAFAAMLILLEAVNVDLGALFMGVTPAMVPRFCSEFDIPADYQPIGAALVGHRHPEVGSNRRSERRKPEPDVVSYGHWGSPPARPLTSGRSLESYARGGVLSV